MRVTIVAVAVSLAVLGVSTTSSAQAALRRATSLPAQNLETALESLAKARTMQIIFRSTLVKDMRTERIEGDFTADEVLCRLLRGTGLTYRYLDENTVTIVPQASASGGSEMPTAGASGSVTSLDPTEMLRMAQAPVATQTADASGDSPAGTPALEEVVVLGKGYGTEVGAKSLAPLLEVPNTVTVIDQQRIREQNLFTLEDVALQTTGLGTTGSDSDLFQFVSRGFEIDNFLVDGVPNNGFSGEIPTLFLYDRVEVLRGPAGLFSGSGSPAGSINLVRKRPLSSRALDVALAAGSWNNYRAEADFSTPLSDRVGARAGLSFQDRDQFYDVSHQRRLVGFGVIDVALTESTSFTAGSHYDEFDGGFFSGLPGLAGGGLADFPRSTFTGADWNRADFTTKAAFAELRHAFANGWLVRLSGQYGNLNTAIEGAYPISFTGITPTDGTGALLDSAFFRDLDYLTVDLNAVGRVALFGREHEVVVGTDYQDRTSTNDFYGRDFLGDYDYYAPVHDTPKLPITFSDTTEFKTKQSGVYGQVRYQLADPLKLVLGGRLSRYEESTTLLDPPPVSRSGVKKNGRFTPYAGLVWTVAPSWTAYASFANTFQPQEARTASGENLPPVVGDQVEIGMKAGLHDEKLLFTLAGYRIKQSNRAIPDFTPGTYLASGKVTATGVDVELNGEILPGWRVSGGYAYIDLEDDAQAGAEVSIAVPEHAVKVWTHYRPGGGSLAKMSFGGGVNWQSRTEAALLFFGNGTGAAQSSYALVNVQVGYDLTERMTLALNVENVFDEKYYTRISGTEFGNFFGAPRSVLATLRIGF